MRFGICYNIDYHPDVHGTPEQYTTELLEQVDLLEELGYDSVWFSEHHCGAYSFGNPAIMATAAAARTKRIRVGTGVSLVPLHNPVMLAEQYALLDVLSGGRLEYGIGRGYLMQEYDWFDVPVGESHTRYREAMDFILQAWQSQGPIDFNGQHFQIENYNCFPKPVQKPFPAIYESGSTTVDSYVWAGQKGLNLGTALFMPDRDAIRRNIGIWRQNLVDHGHDPSTRELCAITQMYCDEDGDQAVADGAEYALNYYKFFAQLDKQAKTSTVPDFYQNADVSAMTAMNDADLVFFGDPDNLTRRLRAVGDDLGIDLLLMEVAQGRAPVKKVRKALETFGKQVMPRLRERAAELATA